jgi:hypothetical protein
MHFCLSRSGTSHISPSLIDPSGRRYAAVRELPKGWWTNQRASAWCHTAVTGRVPGLIASSRTSFPLIPILSQTLYPGYLEIALALTIDCCDSNSPDSLRPAAKTTPKAATLPSRTEIRPIVHTMAGEGSKGKAPLALDLDGHDLPPSPAPSTPRNGRKYALMTELVYLESNDQYNASSVPIYQVGIVFSCRSVCVLRRREHG